MTVVSEKVMQPKEGPEQHGMTLETVRRQIVAFRDEIQEYLSRAEANVEGYKFSVEKHGDGVEIEIELKALIHPRPKT